MKSLLTSVTALSALTLSTMSLAGGADMEPQPAAQKTGFYLSAGAGFGKVDESVFGINQNISPTNLNSVSNSNDGLAWILSAGYRVSPYFAAELGYINFPNVKTTGQFSAAAPGFFSVNTLESGKVKSDALYIAGKLIAPLTNQFDAFAKIGVARIDSEITDTSTTVVTIPGIGNTTTVNRFRATTDDLVLLGGIGVDFYVTNNLAITVQGLTTLKGTNTPATYLATAGLTYQFSV